jgi:hypothetical protein
LSTINKKKGVRCNLRAERGVKRGQVQFSTTRTTGNNLSLEKAKKREP